MSKYNANSDLLQDYANCMNQSTHLVVMPVARLFLELSPLTFPQDVTFYPNGSVQIENLHVVQNKKGSRSLAEAASLISGVNEDVFNKHPLVVFPFQFDWQQFRAHRVTFWISPKASYHLIKPEDFSGDFPTYAARGFRGSLRV